jgi:hypothetical protein
MKFNTKFKLKIEWITAESFLSSTFHSLSLHSTTFYPIFCVFSKDDIIELKREKAVLNNNKINLEKTCKELERKFSFTAKEAEKAKVAIGPSHPIQLNSLTPYTTSVPLLVIELSF